MCNYEIEDSSSSSRRQLTLHIEGKATFDQADELQLVFVNALRLCDHLVVNLEQLGQVDFSFFMLLCGAHRSAQLLKKSLTIRGGVSAQSAKHFDYVRHSRQHGCLFTSSRNCGILDLFSKPEPEPDLLLEAA